MKASRFSDAPLNRPGVVDQDNGCSQGLQRLSAMFARTRPFTRKPTGAPTIAPRIRPNQNIEFIHDNGKGFRAM